MKNLAEVVKLDDNIEEEALVSINNIEFVTFIAYAPYPIICKQQYPVDISFFTDELTIHESDRETKQLIREGDSFRYAINGYLNQKGQLDVGFMIEDELFEDYQYLYGKYVTFKVHRINVEFLDLNVL